MLKFLKYEKFLKNNFFFLMLQLFVFYFSTLIEFLKD